MTEIAAMEIARKAIQLYAETHPRPHQVNQKQAAQMLDVSEATLSKWVKEGRIKLNRVGYISITEVDRLLEAA